MQHNTIVSIGRKCFSRNNAFQVVFPGSCRQTSSRKHAISTPSFPAHCLHSRNACSISTPSIESTRLRHEDCMPSVVCTTLPAPNPASLKSFSTSSLGAVFARRQHHFNHTSTFSPCHRQIRHYTRPRKSYTSKLFYDKNGSVVGVKAAGTRVLLLVGSVLVAWFVLNYAIGAAVMMALKGIWRLVWGSLCWLVWGVYGVLKAIVGL